MKPIIATEVEVIYFRRKDGVYYAHLECKSCNIEDLKDLKILPIYVQITEDLEKNYYIEHVSGYNTSCSWTLWGCKQKVKSILKRARKYLAANQVEEIERETVIF
jgi:hypothetical protein